MSNDTITINLSDSVIYNYDNMNSGTDVIVHNGASATTISTMGSTGLLPDSDTITFSGIDEQYFTVTKAEHTELMDRVAKLEAVMAEEAELRAKHPALKTAYDEYRLLLVLTKQHTPDILTDE